ncbi:hypothetical protein E1265_19180 [Streptomyces sp. 8K308]|uniref:hypothetical protein n=1 Tax=Streptomyces sp. 8K308 TaxID=2530388 RepID=UPI00104CD0A6|nr:hypothetical protein [Streptomyces sp. 8K308]TDC21034.1 hypothetical protein E1265_19180 [Streptomyces sp. 8K308]
MGWHDYHDVARDRRGAGAATRARLSAARTRGGSLPDPRIGFPDILRRRARWVGVRLRHPRG